MRGCGAAWTNFAAQRYAFADSPGSQGRTRLGRRAGWHPRSEVPMTAGGRDREMKKKKSLVVALCVQVVRERQR